MDYKRLLQRYLLHVYEVNKRTFIDFDASEDKLFIVHLTDAEKEELFKLTDEILLEKLSIALELENG